MENSAGSKWVSKKDGYQNGNTGAIQTWNGKRLLLVSCLVLVLFLLSVFVGISGPEVFRENTSMKQSQRLARVQIVHRASDAKGYEVSGLNFTVNKLSQTNQMLYAKIELEPPPVLKDVQGAVEKLQFVQQMFVSVRGYNANDQQSIEDANAQQARHSASQDIGGWGPYGNVLLENMEHNRTIVCSRSEPLCNPTQVFFEHFVEYSNYHVQIKFVHNGQLYDTNEIDAYGAQVSLVFVSGRYTDFELRFKAMFVFATVIISAFYFTKLRKAHPNSMCGLHSCLGSIWQWTWQQRWVALLLVLLVLFNDPLFYASIYSTARNSEITTGFYMVSTAAFVCTLLCFWLAILTAAGRTDHSSSSTSPSSEASSKLKRLISHSEESFLPHCILCGVIFICVVAVNFYERLHSDTDPSFSTLEDIPNAHYQTLFTGSTVLTALYSVWLLLLVGNCCRELCRMASTFRFLFGLTVATIAVVLVGLYKEALSPLPSAAASFMCFYAACNLYVWTLAFAYAPSVSVASSGSGSEHRMDGGMAYDMDMESQQKSNQNQKLNDNPVGMSVLQTSIQTSMFGSGHVQLEEQDTI